MSEISVLEQDDICSIIYSGFAISTEAAPSRPVFDSTNSQVTTDNNMSSGSVSHTVPSGTDLLLVFITGWGSTNPDHPTSVTWNGAGLTKLTQTVDPGGPSWQTGQQDVWYLASPTPGASQSIAWSGGASMADGGIIHIINLSNVDLTIGTSGIRDYSANGVDSLNTTDTTTLSQATTSNIDLLVVQWSQQGNTATTGQTYGGTAGTQTQRFATGFNIDAAFLHTAEPTADGQTLTFQPAGTTSDYPGGNALSIAGK